MIHPIAGLAVSAAALFACGAASAQNLDITSARIIVGDGQVIEKGLLSIRDGKIAAVRAGPARSAGKGVKVIDGTGKTVIAGYIDDHRHIVGARGDPAAVAAWLKEKGAASMRDLLESGVTTVQSGGDDNAGVLELKRMVESGEIKGPRILASAGVRLAQLDDDGVRAAVRTAKASGAASIAEIIYPQKSFPAMPTEEEAHKLGVALDEGAKVGLPIQVHAVSPQAMDAAVKVGAKKLVHTPHFGWLTDDEARAARAAGAQVSSCAGFGAPVFDVFNHDNKPTFRDGKPWPDAILDGQGRGREAGYKPVNGRTLFDNGVSYGYCTDTTYDAKASLAHELKVLNLTFSPADLVQVLGRNSAEFIDRGKDLGTLEVGKLGDVLVLAENPLDGYWNFLTPVVVIKGGVVMVDKRGQAGAGKPMGRAS